MLEKAQNIAQITKNLFSKNTLNSIKDYKWVLKKLNKNPLTNIFYM